MPTLPPPPAPKPASNTICDILNDNGRYSEVSTIAAVIKAASFNFLCGEGGPYTLVALLCPKQQGLRQTTDRNPCPPSGTCQLSGAGWDSRISRCSWRQLRVRDRARCVGPTDRTTRGLPDQRRAAPYNLPASIYTVKVTIVGSSVQISDPARCGCSGGARGVGGLTCGLELELQLSDRTGVKKKHF